MPVCELLINQKNNHGVVIKNVIQIGSTIFIQVFVKCEDNDPNQCTKIPNNRTL